MMDLWDQYAMVLGEQAYDLDKHCELMRLTLLTADLGQIPQGLDTVMIGTADRIRPNAPNMCLSSVRTRICSLPGEPGWYFV